MEKNSNAIKKLSPIIFFKYAPLILHSQTKLHSLPAIFCLLILCRDYDVHIGDLDSLSV